MFDSWESIVTVIVVILIAYAVVLSIGAIYWTYRDVRVRTRDGWAQAVSVLLVAIFNMPGLLLYLILRPHETLNEAYERRLEAEALMREMPDARPACPGCQRSISEEFIVCPQCRTKLRQPCANCGRPLDLNWTACPYCATPSARAQTSPPTSSAAQDGPPTPAEEPKAATSTSSFPAKSATPSAAKE
ncbi:MAG: zinc ribbon domain-containing protein [Chloroflexi bacterium]|nr:zinc ribbon domain-containing protein [Chloroflexota bacterium]